jgi:hypothetical protein
MTERTMPNVETSARRSGRRRAATALVWLVSALALIVVVLNQTGSDLNATVGNVATLLWVVVGAILVTRLPRNRVGWLLWIGGVLLATALGAGGFATYGLTTSPGSVPGAIWLAWLSAWSGAPGFFIAAGFLPLVYPTGRLLSPRWRAVAVLGLVSVVLVTIQDAFGPFQAGSYPPGVQNPLQLGGPAGDLLPALGAGAALTGLGFAVAAAVSLALRYRRSAGVERQQLKFLAYMAAVLVVALAAAFGTESSIAWLVLLGIVALMPVAIGVAVLRYRLYDIDLVIRRTAVYVPLTAALAGIYAASIALLQRLFIEVTGNPSDGAVIISTLVLAATFTPIRAAFQGFVDRRFRDAPDAERRLARFIDDVAGAMWEPNPGRVMRAFLAEAVRALDVTGGAAYVVAADGERLAGRTADRGAGPVFVVPVDAGGRPIGRLELDGRRRGRPLERRDTELLVAAGERLGEALADPSVRPVGDTRARKEQPPVDPASID